MIMGIRSNPAVDSGATRCLLLTRSMAIDAGVGEAVRQLVIANDQSKRPWRFRVLVQNRFARRDIPQGMINAIFLPLKGKYLRSVVQAWRESARKDVDHIVATDLRLFLVAMIAWAMRLRSPSRVTFWIHGVSLVFDGGLKQWIFRLAGLNATLVFASAAIRKAHSFSWHRGHSQVVLNGVQDHGLRANRVGQHQPPVLQYTAAFVELKNHEALLRALARLIAAGVVVELRLVGDGATRPLMEHLAGELGVAPHVRFLGAREDARELLQSCDLYVHPSIGEGFGIAVVEAMFAALPIVAAASGAFPEYLVHDSSALLVDCEDGGKMLSDAILEMLRRLSDGRAVAMGKIANAAAREQFDTSRYITEWQMAVGTGHSKE